MKTDSVLENTFLIIDYGNIRWRDVKKISDYVKRKYALSVTLIRPSPSAIDFQIVDHVIDIDFENPQFQKLALLELNLRKLMVKAGFVFSDRAMVRGTKLLKELSVLHDDEKGAIAALNKFEYRMAEFEKSSDRRAGHVWLPHFSRIRSLKDLKDFFDQENGNIVVKPTSEGNNRGVIECAPGTNLSDVWAHVSPFLSGGIIAEAKIPFDSEYSFDGIANLCFVTKKLSAKAPYPVEYGQQIGSELSESSEQALKEVGAWVKDITGTKMGAFHHEIRFDGKSKFAVVEPNRRPAGMSIWDLAEMVYGMSFYHLLVDSCMGHSIGAVLPRPKGMASIRMLKAPYSGLWAVSEDESQNWISRMLKDFNSSLSSWEIRILKQSGDQVSSVIRQNGDFVAQVIGYSDSCNVNIQSELDRFELRWNKASGIFVDRDLQNKAFERETA